MGKPRILFVCSYSGARSRMAEELTRQMAGERVEAFSASFEQHTIGPLVVEVMAERGLEMPTESPPSVFARYRAHETFDYIVTMCHAAKEECPIFKTNVHTLYALNAQAIEWSYPNFNSLEGTPQEKLEQLRAIRDRMQAQVAELLAQIGVLSTTS